MKNEHDSPTFLFIGIISYWQDFVENRILINKTHDIVIYIHVRPWLMGRSAPPSYTEPVEMTPNDTPIKDYN